MIPVGSHTKETSDFYEKPKNGVLIKTNSTGNVKQYCSIVGEKTYSVTVQPIRKIEKAVAISSQTKFEYKQNIDDEIRALFNESKGEFFEDGVESNFSKSLSYLIRKYGTKAIETISFLFEYQKVSHSSISEALRWIGKIEHRQSYSYRKWIAERCLFNASAAVRDAASIAVSHFDDPDSIPFLETAIRRESNSDVRKQMMAVLEQLNTTMVNGLHT